MYINTTTLFMFICAVLIGGWAIYKELDYISKIIQRLVKTNKQLAENVVMLVEELEEEE